MNSDTITCPLDVWLNAKIFLTKEIKGLSLAKVTYNYASDKYNILLTCDKSLIGEKIQQFNILNVQKNFKEYFHDIVQNLSSLENDTVIMLAHPNPSIKTFWLAKIEHIVHTHFNGVENLIMYEISNIQEIKNFKESRESARTTFRTEVLLHGRNNMKIFYSYNISPDGISLIVENNNQFTIGDSYLLEVKLPEEEYPMPPLNYQCMNIRQDLINNIEIVGFQLKDKISLDPNIQANFELLTWALAN